VFARRGKTQGNKHGLCVASPAFDQQLLEATTGGIFHTPKSDADVTLFESAMCQLSAFFFSHKNKN
jgi:hypothetical protein